MSALEFGAYLKQLRESKKLTMREVDKRSGISHSYQSKIESGRKEAPSPEIIRKLSQALGCTHIGMMIKAGHVTEQEVFGFIHEAKKDFAKTNEETFGDFFRRLRRSKGFKEQKQLSEASGISQATISRIEDGTQYPNEITLNALANALKFPYKDLLAIAQVN